MLRCAPLRWALLLCARSCSSAAPLLPVHRRLPSPPPTPAHPLPCPAVLSVSDVTSVYAQVQTSLAEAKKLAEQAAAAYADGSTGGQAGRAALLHGRCGHGRQWWQICAQPADACCWRKPLRQCKMHAQGWMLHT